MCHSTASANFVPETIPISDKKYHTINLFWLAVRWYQLTMTTAKHLHIYVIIQWCRATDQHQQLLTAAQCLLTTRCELRRQPACESCEQEITSAAAAVAVCVVRHHETPRLIKACIHPCHPPVLAHLTVKQAFSMHNLQIYVGRYMTQHRMYIQMSYIYTVDVHVYVHQQAQHVVVYTGTQHLVFRWLFQYCAKRTLLHRLPQTTGTITDIICHQPIEGRSTKPETAPHKYMYEYHFTILHVT